MTSHSSLYKNTCIFAIIALFVTSLLSPTSTSASGTHSSSPGLGKSIGASSASTSHAFASEEESVHTGLAGISLGTPIATIDLESTRVVKYIGDVAFVLEKITPENAQQWIDFSNRQNEKLTQEQYEKEKEHLINTRTLCSDLLEKANMLSTQKYDLIKDHMTMGHLNPDTPEWLKEAYEALKYEEYGYRAQVREIDNFGSKIRNRATDISGAVGSFERAIQHFNSPIEPLKEQTQLLVAYVTHQTDISNMEAPVDFTKIEMCVTVRTSPGLPLTTHYGIFRTNYPDESPGLEKSTLKDLSMILHGFSGHVLKSMFPRKEVMYTRPIGKMADIMRKKLSPEAFDDRNIKGLSDKYSEKENYTLLDGSIITIHPGSTYLQLFEGGADGVAIKLDALSDYWETRQREG